MEAKQKGNTYFLRLDKNEEILTTIKEFCKQEQIKAGSIMGLGAVSEVEIGLFDTIEKKYHANTIKEAMEITSLVGNISMKDDEVYLHLHINVGLLDGTVKGGHLSKAIISATGEIIIHKEEIDVLRRFDEEIGLNLWEF